MLVGERIVPCEGSGAWIYYVISMGLVCHYVLSCRYRLTRRVNT